MRNNRHHQIKCDETVNYVYPGGVCKSVFEDVEEVCITDSEDLKVEKLFACFDFEAYQWDFDSKVDEGQGGTSWNKVTSLCRFLWAVL